MRRGVVYVGGSTRHLFDQSAALVADRIARTLQDRFRPGEELSYRVNVEVDAHVLASGIGIDIASIEFSKGETWETVIDVLEIKYLPRFTRGFAKLPAAARALKGLWVLCRWVWAKARAVLGPNRDRGERQAGGLRPLDKVQARLMAGITIGTIGSVVYWVCVGLAVSFTAPAFAFSVEDILGIFSGGNHSAGHSGVHGPWVLVLGAILLIFAESVRKLLIEPLDLWAVDSFSFIDYQLDDRRFMATPSAILDAVEFAKRRGYAGIDLMTFSMGAVLAADAIFPRKARPSLGAPNRTIDHWITIGFPYDLICLSAPRYFSGRSGPLMEVRNWMNIAVPDDFIGTVFTDPPMRGIALEGCGSMRTPDQEELMRDHPRHVAPKWLDCILPLRRTRNHLIYWDDEDACAPTCFSCFVDAVGWTGAVRQVVSPESAR